jgi:hypothetical protein
VEININQLIKNKIMKIEQITPYLPYNVKGIRTQFGIDLNDIHTLEAVYTFGDVLTDKDEFKLEYFKPVLYPLNFFNDMNRGEVENFLKLDDVNHVTNIWRLEEGKRKAKYLTYYEFIGLISLKIDVFNLITQGFAIQVTNEFNPYKS